MTRDAVHQEAAGGAVTSPSVLVSAEEEEAAATGSSMMEGLQAEDELDDWFLESLKT